MSLSLLNNSGPATALRASIVITQKRPPRQYFKENSSKAFIKGTRSILFHPGRTCHCFPLPCAISKTLKYFAVNMVWLWVPSTTKGKKSFPSAFHLISRSTHKASELLFKRQIWSIILPYPMGPKFLCWLLIMYRMKSRWCYLAVLWGKENGL